MSGGNDARDRESILTRRNCQPNDDQSGGTMRFSRTACVIMTFMMAGTTGTATARKVDAHDWVAESNQHTQMVLDAQARFNPEGAAALGVDGLDEEIVDLKPQLYERTMAVAGEVLADLRKRLDQTTHPLVRQDIEILINDDD